jgi:hypothetical protein
VPVLFLLVTILFGLDLSGPGLQYYYMYCSIPMYLPTAINSLVAILMIRDYRTATVALFRRLRSLRVACYSLEIGGSSSVKQRIS